MRTRYLFLCMLLSALGLISCVDDKDYDPKLPEMPTEDYALPVNENKTFVHPGCMVAQADFDRAKNNLGKTPWKEAFDYLQRAEWFNDNGFPRTAQLPEYRGKRWLLRGNADEKSYYVEEIDLDLKIPGNFNIQYKDCSAAWSNAVYWKLTGSKETADKAVAILNAWAKECNGIIGDNNRALCVAESGFAFASIAEVMRDYEGWVPEDQEIFKAWLVNIHVEQILDFLEKHFNMDPRNHWSNWDLLNLRALMAIGIYCDRADLYNKAINYITYGVGNGNFRNFIWHIHPAIQGEDDIALGQTQESGRDQGHNLLCIQVTSSICRMAWNQGDDLYGYDDNRFLKGAEYVAKYNYGPYIEQQGNIGLTYSFSPLYHLTTNDYAYDFDWEFKKEQKKKPELQTARGKVAYGFVSIYEHYRKHKNLDARYVKWAARTPVGPDGYILNAPAGQVQIEGETYDHENGAGFGHGTLLFTED